MNTLVVEVPVKRYLKKYLYGLEELPYETPIDSTKGGHLSIVTSLLFTGKLDLPYESESLKDVNDKLPIVLHWRNVDRNQITISEERVRFFNAFLYKSFLDTLLVRVITSKRHGGKEAQEIREVMAELDIIDDFNFDAIKKALYRLRKERNMPLFYDRIRPAS